MICITVYASPDEVRIIWHWHGFEKSLMTSTPSPVSAARISSRRVAVCLRIHAATGSYVFLSLPIRPCRSPRVSRICDIEKFCIDSCRTPRQAAPRNRRTRHHHSCECTTASDATGDRSVAGPRIRSPVDLRAVEEAALPGEGLATFSIRPHRYPKSANPAESFVRVETRYSVVFYCSGPQDDSSCARTGLNPHVAQRA